MSNATLNKSPACGELRQSFTAVCPTCGYEFTDVCESRASQAIYQEIAKYDDSLMHEDSSSSGLSFWTIVGWIFLFPIMMAIFLVKVGSRTASSLKGVEAQKAKAISLIPVPPSRNELLDTALQVSSQIREVPLIQSLTKAGINTQLWDKVWYAKLEQIVKKGTYALKADKETLDTLTQIEAEHKAIIDKNTKNQYIMLGATAVAFILFVTVIM